MVVLGAVLPILLNALVGYVVARAQWLSATFFTEFTRLTFRYLIPCMLFAGIYSAQLNLTEMRLVWSGYFLPAIIIFIFTRTMRTPAVALATTYGNTVLIGLPLVFQTYGQSGFNTALTIISMNSLTLFTLHGLTSGSAGHWQSRFQPVLNTVRNPIVLSLVVGAAMNLLHVPIPALLLDAISMAGRAALPCALLILGASLTQSSLHSVRGAWRQLIMLCVSKLILFPVLVLLIAGEFLELPAAAVSVLVVLAACPSGINALPFALNSLEDTQTVSGGIFVSTLAAIVTLPAWVYLLAIMNHS